MTHVPPADAGRPQRIAAHGAAKKPEVSGLREAAGPNLASQALSGRPAVLAPRDVPGPVELHAQPLTTPAAMFVAALHAVDVRAVVLDVAFRVGHPLPGLGRHLRSAAFRRLPPHEQHAQVMSGLPMMFKAFGGDGHGL